MLSAKKRIRPCGDAEAPTIDGQPAKKAITKLDASPSDNSQELLSLFTDCMTALSTNKIGSQNAFDVGIIDHMNDLVNLDGGSDDEDGIEELALENGADPIKKKRLNFTRASKVVESASKIYGYRIEAVYDLTYNVLMNMNNASSQDGGASMGNAAKSRIRSKAKMEFTSGSNTLASASDVTLTEIPIDNVVLDPYFLKISSMFDQSGAQGLLLTNLQVSNDLALNLDGDNLVFQNYKQESDDNSTVYVSCNAINQAASKNGADFTKLGILPEAAYFRSELQRLLDQKRKGKGHRAESIDTDESQAKDDGNINPGTIGTTSDVALDDFAPDGAFSMQDASVDLPHLGIPTEDFDANLDSIPHRDTPMVGIDQVDYLEGIAGTKTPQSHSTTTAAFMQRLAAIDIVGGSQFSYYTTNFKDMSGGSNIRTTSMGGNECFPTLKGVERSTKPKGNIYRDLINYMSTHSAAEEVDTVGCVSSCQTPKAPPRKGPSIFAAADSTGAIFKFNDMMLTHLGTLRNRVLRISSEYDWRTKHNDENQAMPLLQIYYAKDHEAAFSFTRINENFSWNDDDLVDLRLDHNAGIMSTRHTDNDVTDIDTVELGMDCMDDIAMNVPDADPNPIGTSIDLMYEVNTPDPAWSVNRLEDSVIKSDIAVENPQGTGGIVPATVASYVDIFKIKKTLCSVILPPPEFKEAFEDEHILCKASMEEAFNKETGCMFQKAITDTVNRLQNKDIVDLSSHIMFVCLLHVCNEQELLLRQNKALEDFHICVDAPKEHHLGDYSKSLST
ncbi:hypothetical protein X943_003442 [Babesia divergens]|uniref:Condensin complex subunit 2 n=1 Tax=Babesia divergens TaxID=32595 RepID=A0AAD9GLW5_BABDI|nr:hypothetical protein X943_003442 [Babesia divergens]